MRRWFALAVGLGISACSGSKAAPEPAVFLAFASDFHDFHDWESFDPGIGLPGNDHVSGPRRVYVNEKPAADARAYPVGTILVKESGDGPLASRHVFAMVKRGGGFNADGAVDWEWFELRNVDDANVALVWRGFGPATGDVYGGDATGGCNSCHSAAHVTDYVFEPPVFLHADDTQR